MMAYALPEKSTTEDKIYTYTKKIEEGDIGNISFDKRCALIMKNFNIGDVFEIEYEFYEDPELQFLTMININTSDRSKSAVIPKKWLGVYLTQMHIPQQTRSERTSTGGRRKTRHRSFKKYKKHRKHYSRKYK